MMESPQEQISILYLDDEEHNLSAFKAGFRRKHKIRLALTAEEAFRQLKIELPHIIIADQRMPGISGVEFFERVKKDYPTPTRILLTAYSGSQTVIDAVNRGNIHKYMLKPWDSGLMESILSSAYSMFLSRNEIRKKNQELLRVNEELNRFIYSVSHDLRAPLMSVTGLIDLSSEENDIAEIKNYLNMMKSSVVKMDQYIHTTLEYYRNYKTDLSPSQVDVHSLAESIINGLQNFSRFLRFDLTATEEHVVYTDLIRLKVALSNLISNAAKYGRKNIDEEYFVHINIAKSDTGVTIEVRDHGIGIRQRELESIFDIFSKSDENFDLKSTGLGLFLVKEAVQKIRGKIEVESVYGEGSCFTMTIPDLEGHNVAPPRQ